MNNFLGLQEPIKKMMFTLLYFRFKDGSRRNPFTAGGDEFAVLLPEIDSESVFFDRLHKKNCKPH